MSNNKIKQGLGQYSQWIITSAILFAYFLIVLFSYSDKMRSNAEMSAQEDMAAHGDEVVYSFNKSIATLEQAGLTAADVIAGIDDIFSEESIKVLKSTVDTSLAGYGYICDNEGNAVDDIGNSFNVWGDEDYSLALTGVSVMSDVKFDTADPSGNMYYYAPIIASGDVKGVLCLQFAMNNFGKIPRISEHDGLTVYALMTADGVIVSPIGPGSPEVGSNLYDIIIDGKKTATKDVAVRHIKLVTQNDKNGFQDCTIGERDRYLSYRRVGVNGLYVVEMYSLDYFNRLVNRSYRDTKSVIAKLIIALFLFFAVLISITILNRTVYAKKNKELQSKAETDLLTGLLNKMATQKHIQDFIEGEGRGETGMLCVLDIDNFKKINDTMGHAFGDQVLATLGVRLRNHFRSSDIIGRIGGDEFIVYLKNIKDEDTRKREADRLVGFFRDFQAGDYVKYSATASIGVAMYPADGSSFEELYKNADKGVYLAKKAGKNRLAFYEETKTTDDND